MPFSSKGFDPAHHEAVNHAIERFWKWTGEGAIPVVVDTSPCSYGLLTARPYLTAENQARFDKLRIIDSIEFANDRLLPRLTVARKVHSVVLHPVCSVTKMGLTNKLVNVAAACSDQVTVPQSAGCCAFAGDRGFLFPELTEAATKPEATEVHGRQLRWTLFEQPHLRSRHDAGHGQGLSLLHPPARLCHQAVSFASDSQARLPWRAFFIADSPEPVQKFRCRRLHASSCGLASSNPGRECRQTFEGFARWPWQSSAIDISRRRRAATWGLVRWSRTSRRSGCSIAMDRST